MPEARTPRRWPYRAAKPSRSQRVVRTADTERRGVHREPPPAPRFRITPRQARFALAMAAAVMLASAAWWALRSPMLTVRHVTVRGAAQLSEQQVRAAAAVDGKSIFTLDLAAAQARVAALPNVRGATVRKQGHNGVGIDVEERTTWGSWQMNGVNVPIDVDGYVMTQQAVYGTPTIVEVDPQRVLNAGDRVDPGAVELAVRLTREAESAFGRSVLTLAYRKDAGLTAALSPADGEGHPLWVTFGDSRDYDYKVAALYVLIEQAREQDLALHAVDLRFGDRLSFN